MCYNSSSILYHKDFILTTLKILNFQHLTIKNAIIYTKPFENIDLKYEDQSTAIIVKDPYEYFNQELYNHIYYKMSPKLSKEAIKAVNTLENKDFLEWFDKLNCYPLINPQTFYLDIRKNMHKTMDNLELFDYVVPYEKLDIFLKNISPEVKIQKNTTNNLPFSLEHLKEHKLIEKFIGKDLQLYEKSKELWELSQSNNYKSLKVILERKEERQKLYHGMVGLINETSIKGWVIHKEHSESILVGIYKNNILLEKTVANIMRPDIQKKINHSTGLCGFEVTFENITFLKKDEIEVKTLLDDVSLKLGENAKKFFKN